MHTCPMCGIEHEDMTDLVADEPVAEVTDAAVEVARIEADRDIKLARIDAEQRDADRDARIARLEGELDAMRNQGAPVVVDAEDDDDGPDVVVVDADVAPAPDVVEEPVVEMPTDVETPEPAPATPPRSRPKKNGWWS